MKFLVKEMHLFHGNKISKPVVFLKVNAEKGKVGGISTKNGLSFRTPPKKAVNIGMAFKKDH